MGTPVRNIKGEVVSGVSISGLANEINGDQMKKISELVKEATRQLSLKIGGELSDGK